MTKILRLSHSQLNSYKDCRRKYHHEYNKKMAPRKAFFPFVFGGATHSALEEFYNSNGKNSAKLMKLAINEEFDAVDKGPLTPDEILDVECQRAMVHGICEVYPKIYKGDFQEFKTFLVEHHFELDFGTHAGFKLLYQGFIDGLFQDEAGDWWVFETKTKRYNKPGSADNQAFIKKVHIDNQVLGYIHGGKQILERLGYKGAVPKGVIYNVIQKPGIKKKKAESQRDFQTRIREEYTRYAEEKEYFARYPLQLKQERVDDWWGEMKLWLMEIASKKAVKKKTMFPMDSSACTNKYGTCRWLGACINGKYDKLMHKKKEKNFVHPRLKKIQERDDAS